MIQYRQTNAIDGGWRKLPQKVWAGGARLCDPLAAEWTRYVASYAA